MTARCAVASALLGLCALATLRVALAAGTTDNTLIARGRYLALAGDCVACHTAPDGPPMAGGLMMATPVGVIVSTNITPSHSAGIGTYTEQQFSDAVRRGIRADGTHLYPAMPYASYALLTDDDTRALYAWFMHAVVPVDRAPQRRTQLPFPFNLRASMAIWNLLFLDDQPYVDDRHQNAQWNRGAYLVRGLAHCGDCHTPRNLLMAPKDSQALAGAPIQGWFAPNITADVNSGVGGWSIAELVAYLQQGHAVGKAQAAGPMVEAVDNSLRHLSRADLQAMAVYLKTVPTRRNAADTRPAYAWGGPYDELDRLRGAALPEDGDRMGGAQLYDAHCATCHQARGEGSFAGGLPPLFHNTATGHARADNLVMVILHGIQWRTDGSGVRMPGFADTLSDRQIATLGTYLTQHFGNPTARVTADQVRTLRAGGPTGHLLALARWGLVLLGLVIVLIVLALVLWHRRKRQHVA